MKTLLPDQEEIEAQVAALNAECDLLEKQLPSSATGYVRPKILRDDIFASLSALESHAAQLRVAIRTGAPKVGSPTTATENVLAGKLTSGDRPAQTNAQPPAASASTVSKFHDTREDLNDLQDDIKTSEMALRYYNNKLGRGGRTFLRPPNITGDDAKDIAALSEYQVDLRAALKEAAEQCWSKGLCKRPTSGKQAIATPRQPSTATDRCRAAAGNRKMASTTAKSPPGNGARKLTATEKVLAAKGK